MLIIQILSKESNRFSKLVISGRLYLIDYRGYKNKGVTDLKSLSLPINCHKLIMTTNNCTGGFCTTLSNFCHFGLLFLLNQTLHKNYFNALL